MLITRIIDDICLHKALIFPPHSLHSGYSHLMYSTHYTSDLSTPSHDMGYCIDHGLPNVSCMLTVKTTIIFGPA